MDAVQKGVQMAKAKAFNDIVKHLNIDSITYEQVVYGIENIIDNTFNEVEWIKDKHGPKDSE